MKKDGVGGANTRTGLIFEGLTNLADFLATQKGYTVKRYKFINSFEVFFNDKSVGYIFKKTALYRFLEHRGVKWKEIISRRLLPDDSLYVIVNNTLHIIECKFQKVPGSVDEKLQTCHFKKKQYKKLLSPINIEVEYIYLLNKEWFEHKNYKDVLNYIIEVGCSYYFDYIPLQKLGLPVPE